MNSANLQTVSPILPQFGSRVVAKSRIPSLPPGRTAGQSFDLLKLCGSSSEKAAVPSRPLREDCGTPPALEFRGAPVYITGRAKPENGIPGFPLPRMLKS